MAAGAQHRHLLFTGPAHPAMTIFFTADTHFGDHRTINMWGRRFADTAEMDRELVARWNAVVAPGDVVWHLGDVARRAAEVAALLERLNGTKHLIRGNNDSDATLSAHGGASTADYAEIGLDGHRLVLCHYPFRSWNRQNRGTINLHGHSHGRLAPLRRCAANMTWAWTCMISRRSRWIRC